MADIFLKCKLCFSQGGKIHINEAKVVRLIKEIKTSKVMLLCAFTLPVIRFFFTFLLSDHYRSLSFLFLFHSLYLSTSF